MREAAVCQNLTSQNHSLRPKPSKPLNLSLKVRQDSKERPHRLQEEADRRRHALSLARQPEKHSLSANMNQCLHTSKQLKTASELTHGPMAPGQHLLPTLLQVSQLALSLRIQKVHHPKITSRAYKTRNKLIKRTKIARNTTPKPLKGSGALRVQPLERLRRHLPGV